MRAGNLQKNNISKALQVMRKLSENAARVREKKRTLVPSDNSESERIRDYIILQFCG